MKIDVVAAGNKLPAWLTQGITEYKKRLPQSIALDFIEIPLIKRGKNADLNRIMAKEAQQMQSYLIPANRTVALAIEGQSLSTEQLATKLETLRSSGQNLTLLIGGPEG